MTRHPRVSVVMPVYDAERYLRESIDSILNQTFSDFEILIISEHGTSNESIAIIEGYHDARIRHIRNTRRLGYPRSLNVGLKHAQGEYVALQDADDVSSNVRLEREVEFLDEHPRIGVVSSWFETIDENGRVISKERTPVESAVIKWRLLFYCPVANPSAMVQRTVYDELKGYDVRLPLAPDYEFWTRASQITEFASLPYTLLRYRVHSASLSRANERALFETTLAISRNALAMAIGKNVPMRFLGALARPSSIGRARDYLDVAVMLHDLCLQYTRKKVVSPAERGLIRRDSAKTLLYLAMWCARKNLIFSFLIVSIAFRLAREHSFRLVVSSMLTVARHILMHTYRDQPLD